jgi:ribosome recycling factor
MEIKSENSYDDGMTQSETIVKDLETALVGATGKLKQELGGVRGNRPSVEMVQDIRLSLYDQSLTVKELGSISVVLPRMIQITVWDQGAVGAVANAINNAHVGLSASNDGNTIRATLSSLGDERREELAKLVKKTAEGMRIQVRSHRDDAMKRLKAAETAKEATEDEAFRAKEKMQKFVDKANGDIEAMVAGKLAELGE